MRTCNQKKNSDKNDGQMKKLDERKNCVKSFFFHEKKILSCVYILKVDCASLQPLINNF